MLFRSPPAGLSLEGGWERIFFGSSRGKQLFGIMTPSFNLATHFFCRSNWQNKRQRKDGGGGWEAPPFVKRKGEGQRLVSHLGCKCDHGHSSTTGARGS